MLLTALGNEGCVDVAGCTCCCTGAAGVGGLGRVRGCHCCCLVYAGVCCCHCCTGFSHVAIGVDVG